MSSSLKKLLDSFKGENILLGPIQRHLLAQGEFGAGRRHDVIHPSELARPDFCERAVYYRLSGWQVPKDEHAFQLEVIFAQGHGYHDKWQSWIWDIGMLRGRFRCLACAHGDWSSKAEPWFAVAPKACPECGASRYHLQYGEVPVRLPKYRIAGHSDGDIDVERTGDPEGKPSDPLLEIKSVGEGTVRFEAPKLIVKHTKRVLVNDTEKNWTDWNALWRDIRRPFISHVKQGALYALAKDRTSMLYVYEFKPTGAIKEFEVTFDFEIIADELERCLDLLYAVEKEKPPRCPHGGCEKCEAYEALRDGAQDEEEEGPEDREDQDAGASEGTRHPRRPRRTGEAGGRTSRPRRRVRGSRGVERSGSDGRVRDVHSLGGLLERAGDPGGDHGGDGGEDPPEAEGHRDAEHRRPEGGGPSRQGRSRVVRRRPRS